MTAAFDRGRKVADAFLVASISMIDSNNSVLEHAADTVGARSVPEANHFPPRRGRRVRFIDSCREGWPDGGSGWREYRRIRGRTYCFGAAIRESIWGIPTQGFMGGKYDQLTL
jgi:hypothetical protein